MDCIIWGDRVCTCFCVRLSSNASASLCEKRRFSFGRQYTTERPAIQPFTHSVGVEKSGRSLRRRVQKGLRAVPQAAARSRASPRLMVRATVDLSTPSFSPIWRVLSCSA